MSPASPELVTQVTPGTAPGETEIREARGTLDVSVVVLVSERPASLPELYREYAPPLARSGFSHEFVFVLEPWNHERALPLESLQAAGEPIRVFEAGQTLSEASLLVAAAPACRGRAREGGELAAPHPPGEGGGGSGRGPAVAAAGLVDQPVSDPALPCRHGGRSGNPRAARRGVRRSRDEGRSPR